MKNNAVIIFVGIIFVALIAGLIYFMMEQKKPSPVITPNPGVSPLQPNASTPSIVWPWQKNKTYDQIATGTQQLDDVNQYVTDFSQLATPFGG